MKQSTTNRRNFLKTSTLAAAGATGLFLAPTFSCAQGSASVQNDINIMGPKEGYTPQIGTLVSMMTWMRDVILGPVRGMSVADLDYLHDDDSNSIGAMLWHLAATERFYQIHTFDGRDWGDWDQKDSDEFGVAMGLGDQGRAQIKGNSLSFYMEKLDAVRAYTLQEFAKRDDQWLLAVDNDWPWGPTNNYCKWFHVCEHESNHNGQIKYIRSRIS